MICLFFASLALSEVLSEYIPSANFYLIPSRTWELMAGSLCAILQVTHGKPRSSQLLSALGLTMVLAAIIGFDSNIPFPSFYSLVPVGGTVLIILFSAPSNFIGKLLSMRVPVTIGLLSYSAYLWHQPLFAFARIYEGREPPQEVMAGLAVLTLGLAYLSWRFVELPFRRNTDWPRAQVVFGAAIVSAILFSVGAGLSISNIQRDSFLARLDPSSQFILEMMEVGTAERKRKIAPEGICRFDASNNSDLERVQMEKCAAIYGPGTIILGDSHSADVYRGIASASDSPFIVYFDQQECRPHIEKSPCRNSALMNFLVREQNAGHIGQAVYVQAGFWLIVDKNGKMRARDLFYKGDLGGALPDPVRIQRVLDTLSTFPDDLNIVWLGPRIEPHIQLERYLGFHCSDIASQDLLPAEHIALFEQLDKAITFMSKKANAKYRSGQKLVSFDPKVDLISCDEIFWSDTDHWSKHGQRRFGNRIVSIIDGSYSEFIGHSFQEISSE